MESRVASRFHSSRYEPSAECDATTADRVAGTRLAQIHPERAEIHRFSAVEAHQNWRRLAGKEVANMVAISAFQDAAGNLKPNEFHSSSAHESWAITADSPPRIRGNSLNSRTEFISGFCFLCVPASQREELIHRLKTGTPFGGRTRGERGYAGGFGGCWRRGFG